MHTTDIGIRTWDHICTEQVVLRYAQAIDDLDWALMRSIMADPFQMDYGSLGSLVGEVSVDTWLKRLSGLAGFAVTQHRVTNIRSLVQGDRATVVSMVEAIHFLSVDHPVEEAAACGAYTHTLFRTADADWKISGVKFQVAAWRGGRAQFESLMAESRDRVARGQPSRPVSPLSSAG